MELPIRRVMVFKLREKDNITLEAEWVEDADAVEVIRCKDCKHWNSETKGCKRSPSVEAWLGNDYCSYGERNSNN